MTRWAYSVTFTGHVEADTEDEATDLALNEAVSEISPFIDVSVSPTRESNGD